MWSYLLAGIAVLVGLWLGLVVILVIAKPDGDTLGETVRLLPDTLRLVKRLATDPTIPRRTRLPVWLLVFYLASPIDLVPDFVPVIGYADDAIITSLVLRRLIRRCGPERLQQHWPGPPEGLARLQRLLRLNRNGLNQTDSDAT